MQIKTKVRYQFTSVRIAISKKTRDNKGWQGCGGKQTLVHCWQRLSCYDHHGKHYGDFSKNKKQKYSMFHQSQFWVYIQRR